MQSLQISPSVLDERCEALREEVRAFLRQTMPARSKHQRMRSKAEGDPAFSRLMGERGWIGMTWPKAYGGHERTALERYVVTEELLAAGAPCGAHWSADRQHGPLILRFGSEDLKRRILPQIVRGELYTCIGMSEPDSGSDLASIRTRGERTVDGWVVNGRKLWTSNAHRAHYIMTLVRTGERGEERHAGLSQLFIDLKTPGITMRPVYLLTGEHRWNEIVFDDVLVPHDHLIGEEGRGWGQVTTELAFERSGPERYLSSLHLLMEMIDNARADDPRQSAALGRLVAEIATLRQMSLGVAGMLARGENPGLAGSIVKELGTTFEQSIPEVAHDLFDAAAVEPGSPLEDMMGYLTQLVPAFSIRGGTREILRGIIARGLGVR